MTYETIKADVEDKVAILSMNRPRVLNAINKQMIVEITHAMGELGRRNDVRAIVIRGEGRAFSAGFDLKESAARASTTVEEWRAVLETDFDFIVQFWHSPKPTIAAIHGFCLAGAFEMALACDMTIAATATRLGEPEVRFGSGIVALLLPWLTTPKLAKELLLSGDDRVDAQRAYEMGIVNRVVPEEELLNAARDMARTIASAAPMSVQLTKRAINRSYEIAGMKQALLAALDTDVIIESAGGPERMEFNRIRKEHGLKAAIAWRDARFAKSSET
jgi:enoyl-CoA hydratase